VLFWSFGLSQEGRPALIADLGLVEPGHMRLSFSTSGRPLVRRPDELHPGSQLEGLLVEVWRQEELERKRPFTCAVIREVSRSCPAGQPQLN
jgi:hypothetical protein